MVNSKQYRIMVVVCPDKKLRKRYLSELICKLGFARIPSDAAKLINTDCYDIDLSGAYFVFALDHNLRESMRTNQRLIQMAARGIAIVLGMPRLPKEFEPFVEAFYPEQFN